MSAPGFLAVGGGELANNARTVAYLAAGLGGSEFQIEQAGVCTDLLEEAWPLSVCTDIDTDDQIFTSPAALWRTPLTGVAPPAAGVTFDPSGTIGPPASIGIGSGGWAAPPDPGVVTYRVLVALRVTDIGAGGYDFGIAKARGIGGGVPLLATSGPELRIQSGNINLRHGWRLPGGTVAANTATANVAVVPSVIWFEVSFTATGYSAKVYYMDPRMPGVPAVLTLTYGWDPSTLTFPPGVWQPYGATEQDAMGPATAYAFTSSAASFPSSAQLAITEWAVTPNYDCVSVGNLYPSETLFPATYLYPGLYGVFNDPATDGAPWADADRPESFGFFGLIINEIVGLDTTSTRTMSDAADGIGGILGPTQLQPRDLEVSGWFTADGDQAMEYGRRWFAEVLGGSLCEGCGSDYVDLRSTCSGDADTGFYTNRWRLYDVGVTSFEADTSDPATCGRVTPVTFKLAAANPYLYGPELEQVPETLLNPDGPDAPLVPFESWLFNDETAICTTLDDEQVGEQAPIFTFYGGSAGIEAGLAYVVDPLYPAYGLYPSLTLYPGEDTDSGGDTPFVFEFSVGPGERFIIDAAQRRVVRVLADGVTQVDGSSSLYMGPGDVITWPDTCAGDLAVCARAYAACTCDNTASVTITSMHRER